MIDTDWPDYKPRTPRVRVVRRRLVDRRWLGMWFVVGIGCGIVAAMVAVSAVGGSIPVALVVGVAACDVIALWRVLRIKRRDDVRAQLDITIGGPRSP